METSGQVLYKREDATKGKFAFTTDDYDMYEVCFESEGKLDFLLNNNDVNMQYVFILDNDFTCNEITKI